MNKKVVLINVCGEKGNGEINRGLPFGMQTGPHFSLGINSIAVYLENKIPESSVYVFDSQLLSIKEIEKKIIEIKPDFVGIGCSFKDYQMTLQLARVSKKNNSKVILGGHYVSALAKEIILNRGEQSKDYCVDVVIKQDGEESFYKYIKGEPLNKIENLVYLENKEIKENNIVTPKLSKLILSKNICLEDYFKEYIKRFPKSFYKRPFVFCSQKGCDWRSGPLGGCNFCSLMYKEVCIKTAKESWEEIDELILKHKVDYIWDVSDNFLGDKSWFIEFYKEFKKRKKKPFFKIQASAKDLVVEDNLKILSDLNISQIFIGFESGDDLCLSNIKKGATAETNKKAVSLLSKYNLPIRAYFILGCPGENKESLRNTVKLAEEIINQQKNYLVIPSYFVPLPGSSSFDLLKQKTGDKYRNKDIIDWFEATRDWVSLFCDVSYEEIYKSLNYLRKFPYNIDTYSF